MSIDWLWDRKITLPKVKKILKDEQNNQFIDIAAILLARKNTPKEVFGKYLDKKIFVQNWPRIKKRMRQDNWNNPRIVYWQAIYEKLLMVFKEEGIRIRQPKKSSPHNEFCLQVGLKIKKQRQEKDLTQQDLAKKLGISQQIISRIEKGGNINLLTIKKIADILNKKLLIEFNN